VEAAVFHPTGTPLTYARRLGTQPCLTGTRPAVAERTPAAQQRRRGGRKGALFAYPSTIMLRHLVPNVLLIVLISVMLRFSGLVLAEAVLAYVGIGVDPSMQSWGNMINQARLELAHEPVVWWNLLAAFVFMLGLVLPANVFGDAVRAALDPRPRTQ
jgi:hypothetical protein